MNNTDINAKLDTGSKLEKKRVCKSFADLSQLMNLELNAQQSCEIYKTSISKEIEVKKEIGDE
jgi:beta-lactamase class D